jgi:Leucine-rich repeat (LRR) protein
MKIPIEGKDKVVDTYYPAIKELDDEKVFQEYKDSVINTNNVFISTLAMDFPSNVSTKKRKEIDEQWKRKFPDLKHIKRLNLRHRVDQDYFEAICEMQNLESLKIWTSTILNIRSITKLKKLKSLSLSNFSRLEDISPLKELKSLEFLSILASFKISNYQLIGKMTWLKSLEIGGDSSAPRKLILESLEPFTELCELVELDMSCASIRDKNYRPILKLKKLKRLDAHWRMKIEEREFIQNEHPSLKSGFFVAYDFVKNEFKEGIEWWIDRK